MSDEQAARLREQAHELEELGFPLDVVKMSD